MKPATTPISESDPDLSPILASWTRSSGRSRLAARMYSHLTGRLTTTADYLRRREAALKRFHRQRELKLGPRLSSLSSHSFSLQTAAR